MTQSALSTTIIACGNPSRGDDALGPLLMEALRQHFATAWPPRIKIIEDFQLQVELALDLHACELVLFVDAGEHTPAPFQLYPVQAAAEASYTTHIMSPAAVLFTYQHIYRQAPPTAWLLSVRGEQFELGQGLSPAAEKHFDAALAWLLAFCAAPEKFCCACKDAIS
jgi:hydrogenase maturation protease